MRLSGAQSSFHTATVRKSEANMYTLLVVVCRRRVFGMAAK